MERRIVEVHDGAARVNVRFDVDEDGRPVIERPSSRIRDLEHRLDYLERNYDPTRRGPGAARIVGEMWALHAGIAALRWWQEEDQRERSAFSLLRRLVREVSTYDPADVDDSIKRLLAEASALLEARDSAASARAATLEAAKDAP